MGAGRRPEIRSDVVNLEVFADADRLATAAADVVVAASKRAIDERGLFTLAVSGGSTPRRMLEELRVRDIEWPRVHLFQVDERLAPAGDPARNAELLRQALLTPEFVAAHALGGIWLMPVEEPDPIAAAAAYARRLDEIAGSPVVFDLVQLGLGDDGHTASLVPGDPVLSVDDADVAVTQEYRGHRRMTLTWPVLDRAKEQLWVVAGASKREALDRYLDGDRTIPATLPTQARATVLVDAAAYRSAPGG